MEMSDPGRRFRKLHFIDLTNESVALMPLLTSWSIVRFRKAFDLLKYSFRPSSTKTIGPGLYILEKVGILFAKELS